jgi:hypothetical protein
VGYLLPQTQLIDFKYMLHKKQYFSMKGQGQKKRCVSSRKTSNKDVVCVSTKHKETIFSMKGHG